MIESLLSEKGEEIRALKRSIQVGHVLLSLLVGCGILTRDERNAVEDADDDDKRRDRLIAFVVDKSVSIWRRWVECMEWVRHDHVTSAVRREIGKNWYRICDVIQDLFPDVQCNTYVGIDELLTLLEKTGVITRHQRSTIDQLGLDDQDTRSSELLLVLLDNSLDVWRGFLRQLEKTSNNEKSAFTSYVRAETERCAGKIEALRHKAQQERTSPRFARAGEGHGDGIKYRRALATNANADEAWNRAKKNDIDKKMEENKKRRLSMQTEKAVRHQKEVDETERRCRRLMADKKRQQEEIHKNVQSKVLERSWQSQWSIAEADAEAKLHNKLFARSVSQASMTSTLYYGSSWHLSAEE